MVTNNSEEKKSINQKYVQKSLATHTGPIFIYNFIYTLYYIRLINQTDATKQRYSSPMPINIQKLIPK